MSTATPEKQTGKTVSVGVQELIEKLRNQGVDSGRQEAGKIISDAEAKAAELIADAEKRASAIVGKAREEADFITRAGKEALQLAERNAILELKTICWKNSLIRSVRWSATPWKATSCWKG
ncbi:hypothetical protein [Endozoicomonas sp. GU-1]|uniref:hypothetical protein n=1 Tax=Endozoicomonas sp. GU-1 TaxID=3009078 RepID=UPI0022B49C82|nr:hypothetical protein [Endozoicomonas sp. GU-1]WBA80529.1 hypothetical protein O2T12_19655 [Endozoicomonas sp. GU-1]